MNDMQNIYQRARLSAGITQERAAEFLQISVESLRLYETGKRTPPNRIVSRMGDIYNSQFVIVQHVRQADDLARDILPEFTGKSLEQTTLRMYRLFRSFIEKHRTDDLIDIAEDGIIDADERPTFDAIMTELKGIVAAYYELQFGDFREE